MCGFLWHSIKFYAPKTGCIGTVKVPKADGQEMPIKKCLPNALPEALRCPAVLLLYK